MHRKHRYPLKVLETAAMLHLHLLLWGNLGLNYVLDPAASVKVLHPVLKPHNSLLIEVRKTAIVCAVPKPKFYK